MPSKPSFVFKRTEKKYLLNKTQYDRIRESLSPYMQEDDYGLSLISNIYFDTENFDLIRISTEKPIFKEKLRLRSYGVPKDSDTVFLEIKRKYDGTVYKRRIALSYKEAYDFIYNGIHPNNDSQIMREIDYFMNFHKPSPKVYLSYNRIALYGTENKDIRITFDSDIISRNYDLCLKKGSYGERLINENSYLMEIKIAGAMPLWLVEILNQNKIYPNSFSKYGTVFKLKRHK